MKKNTASVTAYTVLQGLLYTAKSTPHAYLVSDEVRRLGEQVLSHSEEGRKRLGQLDKPGISFGVKIREFIFLPGITLHYILRKLSIEAKAREAIAGGVTQVVCLGAGFDSLALRLSREFAQVNFIEIDHPDTQEFKVSALEAEAGDGRGNLYYLSIDFTQQNLKDRLEAFDGFDGARPTLFICEGVTMYLTEQEVAQMFSHIRQLSGSGTKFLFTAVEPHDSPRNNTRYLLFLYLKLLGEPIKWEMESPNLPGFLDTMGCRLLALESADDFKARFMKKDVRATLHRGEYVALAEFV